MHAAIIPARDHAEVRATSAFEHLSDIDDLRLQLAAIVESTGDAIYSFKPDGAVILSWNPGAARLYGYTAPEVVGRSLALLVPEDGWEQTAAVLERVRKGETITNWETVRRKKDGGLIDVSITISPIRSGGQVTSITVIVRDITEQKSMQRRLAASEARLRLITDTAPVLIAYIDRFQYFRFNNRHYADWFDRPIDQIVHRSVREVLGEEAYEGVRQYIEAALNGQPVTFERLMRYENAPARYIRGAFEPDIAESGEVLGFVSVVTDISDICSAQEERERSLAEIQALNARLRRAMTETHHRVKNNLQIITALINIQTMEPVDAIPKEEVKRIGIHIRALAAVHDILTEQAKRDGNADAASAEEILTGLLPILQEALRAHRLDCEIQDLQISARQGSALAIIVNELVSNAVKYGGGEVEVALFERGGAGVLEVRDMGPGFPADFVADQPGYNGLELVENQTRWDLGGYTRYLNGQDGGACVQVVFPLESEIFR